MSAPLPEGTVTVRLRVTELGTVESVAMVHPLNPVLDAEVQVSALRWKFIAATNNGRRIPAEVDVDVIFTSPNPYIHAPNSVFQITKEVMPPRAILTPDPEYTKAAREAKVEGVVVLWVLVNEQGDAEQVRVQRSFDAGLDQKAVNAVRKWKFEPAKRNGQPVAMIINVEVNFRLD
jgi:TonB family protein